MVFSSLRKNADVISAAAAIFGEFKGVLLQIYWKKMAGKWHFHSCEILRFWYFVFALDHRHLDLDYIRLGMFNPWATRGLVQLAMQPRPWHVPSIPHCSSAQPQSAPTAQQQPNICALLTLPELQPIHREGTVQC